MRNRFNLQLLYNYKSVKSVLPPEREKTKLAAGPHTTLLSFIIIK